MLIRFVVNENNTPFLLKEDGGSFFMGISNEFSSGAPWQFELDDDEILLMEFYGD